MPRLWNLSILDSRRRGMSVVDTIVRRFLLIAALSVMPGAAVTLFIFAQYGSDVQPSCFVAVFLFTLAMSAVMLYSLEHLALRLAGFLFPRRSRMQASLRRIAKKLGSITSSREAKELCLPDILEAMRASGAALVNQFADRTEVLTEGDITPAEAELAVMEQRGGGEEGRFCAEVARNEEYVCSLVLAPRPGRRFGSAEIKWLQLVLPYLSVGMENLHLLHKLTLRMEQLAARLPNERSVSEFAWFRKLMFELQENERARIATDLHDTTMQDLFFLKRRLVSLFDRYDFDPEDARRIDGILEYIDVINMNLRQSCFELHPYLLREIGLIGTIEKLLELERGTAPFRIEFETDGAETIERCDPETKRQLFRVVQELLSNAKKHSGASRVRFRLQAAASFLTLSYEDDGVGFDGERSAAAAARDDAGLPHIGLEQLKSRILSLDGDYDLKAGAGSGMKFAATLPLKEGRTA